ncbi:hypothetical protein [Alloscardovia omnicolens]|uniref:hypothetical protein n=1 Tax=Alloscardovia omnicolens TaxID=419015 RepID=UPI00128B5A59|nr:hypothetical protein [Alloscardovia omnicolens]
MTTMNQHINARNKKEDLISAIVIVAVTIFGVIGILSVPLAFHYSWNWLIVTFASVALMIILKVVMILREKYKKN